MEQLEILDKEGNNYVILELSGVINSYTLGEFQKKAYDYIKKTNLVLNMSAVTEIDASGIGVLMGVYNESEDTDYQLYLMRPSGQVAESLEATGFYETFNRIYSVTEVS